jgi:hypothetical protein
MVHDTTRDWLDWHRQYDDPKSRLARRLRVVQDHILRALKDRAGQLRVISMCAGQGRDLLGVLADHHRRDEVAALLLELDPRNVEIARAAARRAGLDRVRVMCADASISDTYDGAVPADIILACGVFGNISNDDIERTIAYLPRLCASRATVVWTRAHEPEADVPSKIRRWFDQSGFEEVAFDAPDDDTFRVGTHRLTASPRPLKRGARLFRFIR